MIDQQRPTTIERRYDSGGGAAENLLTTTMSSDFHVAVARGVSARRPDSPVLARTAWSLEGFVEEVATRPSATIVEGILLFVSGAEEPVPRADFGIGSPQQERTVGSRRERHAAVIALLEEWLADDTGYDEATWPSLKEGIEQSRTSTRKRFNDQTNRP